MNGLRIFTWHVHGNYLYYLSQISHEIYIPVQHGGKPGYGGRGSSFAFGPNVIEVAAADVRNHQFDCILFQSRNHYLVDQYELLSEEQRQLPRIYLEHDPPRESPTETRHPVEDENVLLVHVTPFNALMWDSGRTPSKVIEHGVLVPDDVRYTGNREAGIVVVNNLGSRGRRLGPDIFNDMRQRVPLDLVGMGSKEIGGLGEIPPMELPAFEADYRFFLNPIRWTSLGLAVCEAMTIGMPILGLATTEMVTAVENGKSGFVDTRPERLEEHALRLLKDPAEARWLGENARKAALERFNIQRFVQDWEDTFALVTGSSARKRVGAPAGVTA